jgi:succinoglycan biosynthesis transport protein ExoP
MRLKFWQRQPKLEAESAAGPVQTRAVAVEPQPGPAPAVGDLDVRAIWRALVRRRNWILIPTVAAMALSFVAVNVISPRYKSEARILIDGRENVFLKPTADRVEDRSAPDAEAVTSQVQLLLSRDLARDIIKKNKLAERAEFDPMLQGVSPLKALLALIGIARDPFKMTAEERVLDAYYDRLAVYAVDKSRVIVVEFQSRDPDLAAQVANSIAEGYLVLQQGAKQDQARSAGQWLSGRIDDLRKKVADADSRVEDLRTRAGLFVGTNNTTLSNQQMGEINTQLNNARAQKASAESKARLIRDMLQSGSAVEVTDVLNSEFLRRLNEQRVTLRAQLAEQSATLLDGHPRIKELKAQVNDLDRQIRDEAAKAARSFENDAKLAGATVTSLSGSLDQLKKQAGTTNEQDVQLRALDRDAKSQRDLLESYLAKYREATARENIDAVPADARVISRGVVSNTPAYPKKVPIVVIATLATFMLATGLVVTGELLKMTAPWPTIPSERPARSPSEPIVRDRASGLRVREPRPAPLAAANSEAELERLAEEFIAAGARARKITVIGAEAAAGTSLAALTLARLMSRKANVVLVDLSLEPSALSAAAVDPSAPGVSDLVSGAATFGQIITRDRMSRVQIVGAGQTKPQSAMLKSPRLALAIDALTQVYDHVILDAGAIDDLPEELAASNAQALLVTRSMFDNATRAAVESELIKAGFRSVAVLDTANDNIKPDADGTGRAAVA